MIPRLNPKPEPDYVLDRKPRYKTMKADLLEDSIDWTKDLLGEDYYDG